MKKEKVSLPLNPYIAGPAIRERKAFFGREDVFREVMKVLRHQHNNAIVLYGQRRIGKTSVLLQLESRLADDGEFTPIYFDLQDKAAKPLSELLYEIALIIAAQTGQATPNHNDFDDTGNYFRHTFLPAVAGTAGVGRLVLLFDEFDVMDNPQESQAGQAFFPTCGSGWRKCSR
jgi:branched-chain amino acid transport system substrate-binding protein